MRSPEDARAALRELAAGTRPKPPAGRKARSRAGEQPHAREQPAKADPVPVRPWPR